MSRVAMFEQQLADAVAAGNTASANRLKFIISKEKRNAANRDEKQEDRKRKAEDQGTGPYKAMRFTDNGVLPASMGTIRDMLLEERTREQEEIKAKAEAAKKREQERVKAEQARRTAECNRKKREYKARQEAEAKREREAEQRRKEEARERGRRDLKPKSRPQPKAQPTPPRPAPRPSAPPATVQEIQAWRTFANACFADYSKVLTFPAPPGGCCAATGCQAAMSRGRSLKACDCNIRRAFRNTDGINYKSERLKWHPDRWAKCPVAKRDEMVKKAQEMFVVINAMV